MDYDNLEQAYVTEGTEDGDTFRKIVRVRADDGSETSEFLAFKKGTVREERQAGGGSVLIDAVEESVSIGAVRELDQLADGFETALRELNEKIDADS